MSLFLITYGILAFVSFVVFIVLAEIGVKDQNSLFVSPVLEVNYLKAFVMSVFFPLTWVCGIVHVIVNMRK